MLLLYCGLLLLSNMISINGEIENQICKTPDGQQGTCKNIKTCPSVLKLVMNTKDKPKFNQYLAGLNCGKNGSDPMVCCIENESNVDESYSNKPKCGQSNIRDGVGDRIRGGRNASLGNFPWMVALGYYGVNSIRPVFLCGGALVSEHWIVTAKHCVNISGFHLVMARLGDLDLADNGEDGAKHIDVPILEVVTEDDEDDANSYMGNDIAIVKLWKPPKAVENITKICMLNKGQDFNSEEFYTKNHLKVIGWGDRGTSNTKAVELSRSNVLQETDVYAISNIKCRQMLYNHNLKASFINEKVICTTSENSNVCMGDSGSPLMVIMNHTTFYLAGVVSHGPSCGQMDLPAIYTKVSQHHRLFKQIYD